ncbi:MAG TPA: M20/M25/M40 family metallo-hydrolase, partial [Pyrinomonadaceae bacterium]|nr:M20/M25/M40 family metallo-hydrolase [Pyrinomonadaceae bacterium]
MIRKFFTFVLFFSISLTAALAQQPQQTASANRLRQAIEYLASDALEGRRTGTPGANGAAHYIAGEFSLLGLRTGVQMSGPARTRGEIRARYLQPFPFVSTVELGKNNSLTVITRGVMDAPQGILQEPLRVGESWVPLGFSTNATVESGPGLILAGYGLSAPELKYNDYATVKDRVAVVLAGTPDGDNPHGQFAQAGQVRFKAAAARAAGARALIIISAEKNLKDDRLSRLSYDNAGEAGLPVILVSHTAGATLLGGDEPLAQFEKDAAAHTLDLPAMKSIKLTVDVVRRESPSFNIVGILPGSDPKLKNEAIVIGAHYDHLGRGGEGSLAPREGDIHHGADDNASGTAALIELARLLSVQGPKPRRTIVFVAFSGEEEGLIGSNYYVNHPVVPLQSTVAMINMDMIGRLRQRSLMIGGVGTASEWRSLIDNNNSTGVTVASMNVTPIPVPVSSDGKPVVNNDPSKKFDLTLNEDGYGP